MRWFDVICVGRFAMCLDFGVLVLMFGFCWGWFLFVVWDLFVYSSGLICWLCLLIWLYWCLGVWVQLRFNCLVCLTCTGVWMICVLNVCLGLELCVCVWCDCDCGLCVLWVGLVILFLVILIWLACVVGCG